MKKILLSLYLIICFVSISNFVYGEDEIVAPEITPPIIEEILPAPILEENLTIRDGDKILFSGTVPLPDVGMVDLNDNTETPRSINTRSVLSVLKDADIASADFTISNLEYYTSFGSLYLKCITGITTGEKCDNWQYTVNNSYPSVSMDQNILSGGENIYIYFGQQYRVLLETNEITTSDVLTITAEEYDYQNNIWKIRTGVTVGLTQPNPDNPWSPIEVTTSTVDTNGQAVFSGIAVGSYNAGIKEDFYFPTEQLTVITPPSPPPPALPSPISSGGGGALPISTISIPAPKAEFNLKKAFDFLTSQQKEDGSFGENIYTDWTSIAFASSFDYSDQKEKLKQYLSGNKLKETILTDYERRAMALLALGENPYSFYGTDYIAPIISSFDGVQFGDPSLVNDDIFALIPLASAGYSINDDMITKDIQFILSKQQNDGSWDGSVDLTGAAIQALKPFDSFNGVSDVVTKAGIYIANKQENDGGWGNVFSTSWAMQAESMIGANWIKNNKNGKDYLATQQPSDGAVLNPSQILQNRIWATSYAIPAVLGKSWDTILHSVSKPVLPTPLLQPETLLNTNNKNTVAMIPAEKKSTVITPIQSSSTVVSQKTPPFTSTQEITLNALSATTEKSGVSIPTVATVIVIIFTGGIVLIRFTRRLK